MAVKQRRNVETKHRRRIDVRRALVGYSIGSMLANAGIIHAALVKEWLSSNSFRRPQKAYFFVVLAETRSLMRCVPCYYTTSTLFREISTSPCIHDSSTVLHPHIMQSIYLSIVKYDYVNTTSQRWWNANSYSEEWFQRKQG